MRVGVSDVPTRSRQFMGGEGISKVRAVADLALDFSMVMGGERLDRPTQIDGEFNLWGKTPEISSQWRSGKLSEQLQRRVRHLAIELYHIGCFCILTRLLDEIGGESGVHPVGRGADARITCTIEQAEKLRATINRWFPYGLRNDGKQGETIVDLDHGTAPHFHVQVSQANA